jgi:hypothetical protein
MDTLFTARDLSASSVGSTKKKKREGTCLPRKIKLCREVRKKSLVCAGSNFAEKKRVENAPRYTTSVKNARFVILFSL